MSPVFYSRKNKIMHSIIVMGVGNIICLCADDHFFLYSFSISSRVFRNYVEVETAQQIAAGDSATAAVEVADGPWQPGSRIEIATKTSAIHIQKIPSPRAKIKMTEFLADSNRGHSKQNCCHDSQT